MKTLKELIKGKAIFQHYRDGSLWYMANGFLFPVPISDIGNATFLAEDKAILYMRYIRKYLKELENEHKEKRK